MEQSSTTSSDSGSKQFIIACIAITGVVLAGIGAAVYAASIPTGTIKVYTYDDTTGQHESLGNVEVTVDSVNSSAECTDNTKKTNGDHSSTGFGSVIFTGCKARTYSKPNRKFLKYSIAGAEKSGYQIKHGSKFKRNEQGKLEKSGGSFVVRANKQTNVEILMETGGTPQTVKPKVTPVVNPGGGGGGSGSSSGLPASPNSNDPIPCGTAFIPGNYAPLAAKNVVARLVNPTSCPGKASAHVS